MSKLLDEKKLQPVMATLTDYITEFSHQLTQWRYLEGGFGDWSDIIATALGHDPYVELLAVYASWINWPYPTPWKPPKGLHFFRIPASASEDWPPPQWWMFGSTKGLASAELPQEPQVRRRIRLPDGSIRSIRIKQ